MEYSLVKISEVQERFNNSYNLVLVSIGKNVSRLGGD